MSHYQKLATLLIRFAAFLFVLFGLMGLLFGLYARLISGSLSPEFQERLTSSVLYLIGGVILFALARLLGKVVGRHLE